MSMLSDFFVFELRVCYAISVIKGMQPRGQQVTVFTLEQNDAIYNNTTLIRIIQQNDSKYK